MSTISLADAQELIPLDPINLTNQKDIEDIENLSAVVDDLTKKVMACMETGKDNLACQCKYLLEAKQYQRILSNTLEKHPEWVDKSTYYEYEYKENDIDFPSVMGKTTSFIGHQRQSVMIDDLVCNK